MRLPRSLALLLALATTACTTTLRGFVDPGPPPAVVTLDGVAHRIATTPTSEVLRYMDGHLVEVVGPRWFGRTRAASWRVLEGRNGLPVWVGVLERRGRQLVLFDHTARAWYVLDDDSVGVLAPYVGKPVLVEGYIDGAHHVEVVYFRVLAPDASRGSP